ncbi:TetR/AcrR family transcriptional regulator [Hamadaea sp. NPDC050747]|uniref:TetR/AcrR family transcriptional regulator n=1 Tax=Hamadaea sp. NPDC050747 TaxID=3155789 RepID=UPI0033EB960A
MTTKTDGRVVRGDRTRNAVLDAAVAMATESGLDGLSLGQLAERLGVSKSGLFAHWRSKEELQLAAIEHARKMWADLVVAPALQQPRGVRRIFALHEARLRFYSDNVLPGGCFFAVAEFEHTGRTGVVPDRLGEVLGEWLTLLRRLLREAVDLGELPADLDVEQLAFEIDAAGVAAMLHTRLLSVSTAHARTAVLTRLRALTTDPTLLPEER